MVEEPKSLDERHSKQGYIAGIPRTCRVNGQDDKGAQRLLLKASKGEGIQRLGV